jgi:2,3-bisphosphoglycerate-dependent phosphoglycerate mutase
MRYQLISLILLIAAAAPLAHAQEAIFLIRHAEQVHDVEDPPLTEDGVDRAKTWATVFRDAGIKMIYTSKKMRTQQTGQVIAQELDVPLEQVSRRDIDGLVNQVRKEHTDDLVLIVTHSKTLPKLLKAFAPTGEYPVIRPNDYDNLFIVVPKGKAKPTVMRLRY